MEKETTNLELHIQYILKEDEITIISCKGYGTEVFLPGWINGYPVRRIGAYAFSDPVRSLSKYSDNTEVLQEVIPGIKVPGGKPGFLYGQRLQEISLPKDLRVIDEYAFYNCKELTTVNLAVSRIQIENGAFMNCDKLYYINIDAAPEDLTSARNILIELISELCITFSPEGEKVVFLFPEYYEYSVENTPARILQEELYGAGYRYRLCFNQGRMDVMGYDTLFQTAEIQRIPETALRIAFLRLLYPYKLEEAAKKQYLDLIIRQMEQALKLMISQNNIIGLNLLTNLGIMTEKNFVDAQEMAVRTGHKECAGIVLKARLHYFPPKEKEYDL
ncbi:leucine-rich repeat protein [Anaerocolumna sp. AGMB13025]|uniref:leucine-rich repeat protein n=1 Tax=Anaerocolumna sp. AGMB13025 TaxID=3039116 RepID=UPI00241C0F99|nr:leucine-rich repeat protein [Anaerocolumna sp. AGMB13025]WFR55544.1 leucine-rich repeat protein [Anaerocolumna sp. AGMB13025]